MENFKILGTYTGDIGVEVYGKNIQDLLKNLIECFCFLLFEKQIKELNLNHKIAEKEYELEKDEFFIISLLQEFIYEFDVNKLIPIEIKFQENDNYKIKVVYKKVNDHPKTIIKAATYHSYNLKKENNQLKATIVFDV